MFQQKQIEEYQNMIAPTELKERVRFSVTKARRTMKQRIVAVGALAAGIALFCVSSSLLGNRSTILSVNDVVVTQKALRIENENANLLPMHVGQQRSLPIHIPMEIEVTGKTEIEVNVGTLMQVIDENQYSEETTRLELSENAEFYWILDCELDKIPCYTVSGEGTEDEMIEYWPMDEDARDKSPVCIIKRGGKTEKYVVEYRLDTESYSIRKTN